MILLRFLLIIISGSLPVLAYAQPADLSAGEKVAWSAVDDTVRIDTTLPDGSPGEQGFGFVVGLRSGTLYIVTADHVVRGDDGRPIGSIVVTFHSDQGNPRPATLLALQVPPAQGDLAVLDLPVPPNYVPQWPTVGSTDDLVLGSRAWRVGKQRHWLPAISPGQFAGLQHTIWLGFDDLDTPPGSSGGPVVTEDGVIGMVVAEGGLSGVASSVLPIQTIATEFRLWQLPWNLASGRTSQASEAADQAGPGTDASPQGLQKVVLKTEFALQTPDTFGDSVAQLLVGDRVTVLQSQPDGWVEIHARNGVTGFVKSDTLGDP